MGAGSTAGVVRGWWGGWSGCQPGTVRARSRWRALWTSWGPGCFRGEVEDHPAPGAVEGGWDGEQPVAEPFGFPAAGVVTGQSEQLHPGGQVDGEGDDGAPDLVLSEVVQRQVGQSGVLGHPDAVFGAGSAAVPQFQVGQLGAGAGGAGVGGERGDPHPVDVGEPQLGPGMGPFLAADNPHAFRPAGQIQ